LDFNNFAGGLIHFEAEAGQFVFYLVDTLEEYRLESNLFRAGNVRRVVIYKDASVGR
jgi:hypothetical protein